MGNVWFSIITIASMICAWLVLNPADTLRRFELHLCFHFSRYNNKTYRIDDINWEVFPSHTFHGRFKGVERDISYRDYYLEVLIVFFFVNCSSWWQIPSWERYRYFQKLHKHSQPYISCLFIHTGLDSGPLFIGLWGRCIIMVPLW